MKNKKRLAHYLFRPKSFKKGEKINKYTLYLESRDIRKFALSIIFIKRYFKGYTKAIKPLNKALEFEKDYFKRWNKFDENIIYHYKQERKDFK